MAILIRSLLPLLIACLLAVGANAAVAANEYIALCYHEVERDDAPVLTRTAVRVGDLAAQFAWLQANGYRPVSLQQILDARKGGPALPDKAVLLTFDDGRKDVYTRVFPLLRLFRYPAVVALVGHWLDVPAGGIVDYDGTSQPRDAFVSWDEVRAMQRSGLVEIASHSYDLHRALPANPLGNTQPSAVTRRFDGKAYEADDAYLSRLRTDLQRNRDLIQRQVGVAPRAVVWPYGRSNVATQSIAADLGMPVGMTLEDGANDGTTPLTRVRRYLIEESPSLQSFAEAIRHLWQPDPIRSVRLVPGQWPDIEAGLSAALDRLQRIAPNVAFVDPRAGAGNADDEAGAVLFPTSRRPLATDELNRIAWQIERRAGVPVFIDLPASWLNDPLLLADLARHVNFAGVRVAGSPTDARVQTALTALTRWRWPLRVAYVPPDGTPLPTVPPGDLLVVPATIDPARLRGLNGTQVLFEFELGNQSLTHIAAAMQRLEADGWRQFGVAGFPDAAGAAALWRALSLRSQPLLP